MRALQYAQTFDEYPSYKGGYTVLYGKYVWEFAPDHPLRNMWGWIAQHRLVAEDAIGRALVVSKDPKVQEIVHHKDENPLNNDPSNLQVMTMSAHRSLHSKLESARRWAARNIDPKEVEKILKTMSIKKTAEHFGTNHQTLRNRYPLLLAPYKRKSPVRMEVPDPDEIALIRKYAADKNLGVEECRKAVQMSTRTVLRLCQKLDIVWIRKSRKGEIHKTYRGQPTQNWLTAHGKATGSA